MKKTIENNSANIRQFITEKNIYIQEIIENTISSIQIYKRINLFSENDINLSLSILLDLYEKINNLNTQMNNNNENINTDNLLNDLQKIIDKLSLVICGFGTKKVEDMLFVCFGSEFKNLSFDNPILNDKLKLITKYLHPINYKLIPWKNSKNKIKNSTNYCCSKITEDTIEIENLNQIECLNESVIDDIPTYEKINYIKCIIQNKNVKKTLIINCIADNIPIHTLNNLYIKYRINELEELKTNFDNDNCDIYSNIVSSLSLKDILIYSKDDIFKRVMLVNKDVNFIKQNHIDTVVKKFLELDIVSQRNMLINLLLYKEDNDIQYICYILYDLINSNATCNDNVNHSDGSILYESLPWYLKQNFKNIIKSNIKQNQEIMQKYETSKITLEQQIYMLKVDESTKEKAINKLKEIKNKPDEVTMKTKQYLEGLVKIPFSTFYEEPITKYMKDNNAKFAEIISHIPNDFYSIDIEKKNKYTIKELTTHIINIEKNIIKYIQNTVIDDSINFKQKTYQNVFKLLPINEKKIPKKKTELQNVLKKNIHKNNDLTTLINIYDHVHNTNIKQYTDEIQNIKNNSNLITNSIQNMETSLNESIHGHNHAKNQIMKIIGQWMNGEKNGYCFGFEGSPGIGKTSLASKGLTRCLTDENGNSRPFSFIALGGSSNGSFLEGHSYTYMNSTWGRIVEILMDSKCMNPIIYIDELDKVSKTEQGKEIIGILTHLIDPTQNSHFQDKYFAGINIDLSKVLFIFSYNDYEQIDRILLDRIHRIKFENLDLQEKITIVKLFILPEIDKKMGFENTIHLDDNCIEYIIKSYTLEPGVRKLKEILFDLYGEINLEILKNENELTIPIIITKGILETKYLTKYNKIVEKTIHEKNEIGIINGLWANNLGCGGIIPIQTLFYPSPVFLQLQLTGLQGDVMKESMNVAKTLAWSLTDDNVKQTWLEYFDKTKCQGLHIHCPEGSISKDGPSAGAAITTAIYSLLNNLKIKKDIAITGEITLSGSITAIGGLDIKINSGIRAGIKTFLFPKENHRDYLLWKEKFKNDHNISLIEIVNIKEIFEHVFE
jgi:ATP-dependent Lon protease